MLAVPIAWSSSASSAQLCGCELALSWLQGIRFVPAAVNLWTRDACTLFAARQEKAREDTTGSQAVSPTQRHYLTPPHQWNHVGSYPHIQDSVLQIFCPRRLSAA